MSKQDTVETPDLSEQLGGVPVSSSDSGKPTPARSIDVQSPGMTAAGQRTMVLPDAANQDTLYSKKVPDEGTGLTSAYFGSFNKTLLALPDIAINALAYGAEKSGLLEASDDPQANRNILTRFFNAADYKQKQELLSLPFGLGSVSMGAGEPRKPTTFGEKVLAGAGEASAYVPYMIAGQRPFTPAIVVNRNGVLQEIGTGSGTAAREAIQRDALIPAVPGIRGSLDYAGRALVGAANEGLNAFAANPARVTLAELLSNAASGATGTAEEEFTGHRTGVGDIAGGTLPTLAVAGAKLLYKWSPTRNLLSWAHESLPFGSGKQALEDKAQETIGVEMQKAFDSAMKNGNLQEAQRIAEEFKKAGTPLTLTPAELSQDTTLRLGQEASQRAASGESARRNVERINTNIETVQNFLDLKNPYKEAAPTAVVSQLHSITEGEQGALSAAQRALREESEGLAGTFPNVENRATEGANIRRALQKAKDDKKVELDKLATDIGLDEANPGALFNPVKKAIREAFFEGTVDKPNDVDRYLPKVIRDFVNDQASVINFQTWKKYRDKVGDELSAAIANNQGSDIKHLAEFKERLDTFGNLYYSTNENWVKFKDRYREEYALPFERGIAYQVLSPSSASRPNDIRYVTSDEAVAKSFTKNVENATDFLNLYKDKPEAVASMRNVILDGAKDTAVKDGVIIPSKLETFITKNREILTTLGLHDELSNVQSAASAMAERQVELKARQAAINSDRVNKLLDRVKSAELSPEQYIDQLISRPADMKAIVSKIDAANDSGLKEAFNQAVWTRLRETNDISNPGGFLQAINDNRRALEMSLGKEHLKNLETAAKGMGLALYADAGAQGSAMQTLTGVDKFERYTGITLPSLFNAVRSAGQKQVSPEYLAFAFGGRFINARQRAAFDQVMEKVMYDSDFAKLLAEKAGANGTPTKRQQDKLQGYMYNLGLRPDGRPYAKEEKPEETPVEPSSVLPSNQLPAPKQPRTFKEMPAIQNKPLVIPQVSPTPVDTRGAPVVVPSTPTTNPESGVSGNTITVNPRPGTGYPTPAAPPVGPAAPQKRSSMEYQNLFPNDPLGAILAQRRAG